MPACIDLSKAHLSRVHGDITVVFSWFNDERAMFLIPHMRRGAPWYIVMEGAAWTWDDRTQKGVTLVASKAVKACEVLGIEPTPHNCRRVAAIIIDGLEDLVRMPSAPPQEYLRASFGQMQLRANGEVIAADDIRVERGGVSYA